MRKEIVVNSIFEGLMPSGMFGAENQYLMGLGIDPDVPLTDNESDIKTGGGIRPVQYSQFSGTEIDSYPVAIINTPQSDMTWVVLANGKVIAYKNSLNSTEAFVIGQVQGENASGAWYYNNYIWITGTEDSHDNVSRVGPMDIVPFDNQTTPFTVGAVLTGQSSGATGTIVKIVDSGTSGSLFLDKISGIFLHGEIISDSDVGNATVNRTLSSLIVNNIWKGSKLGSQPALGNATYPQTLLNIPYLNHFGFAHNNGASYFLDYTNGLGLIHKIQTRRDPLDIGDTNDGSVYQSVGDLSLPHDYIPITACSYGTDIVISGTKTVDSDVNQGNASLFFWDAAEELFYRVVKLPDPMCSVLKYVNGTLYGLSGDLNGGYRLWRYVGGDAIETLKIIEDGHLPLQMSCDLIGNRMVWGADTELPTVSSGLYAYGSKSDLFPRGLHHIALSGFN